MIMPVESVGEAGSKQGWGAEKENATRTCRNKLHPMKIEKGGEDNS